MIAKHHDARRVLTRRSISGDEPPTHERCNAPVIRGVRRHVRRDDVLGDIAISGRQVPSVLRYGALDSPRQSQLLQLRTGQSRIPETASTVTEGELHHPIGAHVGEGIDQDAVDDAEHGARGAYPQGQREDRRERKPWTAAHFPRRITEIGDDGAHNMGLDENGGAEVGSSRHGPCQRRIAKNTTAVQE